VRLFLIPTPISDSPYKPPLEIFGEFQTLYVENLRSARRFISSLGLKVGKFEFIEIPKKLSDNFLDKVIFPSAILSEAGCPGVADPGSEIVRHAHKKNIEVVPLVGPSSIVLALMASGLNGQDFHFHGYLPIKDTTSAVKRLEKEPSTHIFIETPYRNQKTFESCLKALSPNTLLLVAYDITGSQQFIKTKTVSAWQKDKLILPKLPCVFGFLRSNR
jgi:16S rRNA (cytidine1402-2'-O)-methyltransferase